MGRLVKISVRIVNEVDNVNRIVYDVASKPQAMIEREWTGRLSAYKNGEYALGLRNSQIKGIFWLSWSSINWKSLSIWGSLH